MKNKIIKYDFLIVGGGLIGSLAAICLSQKNYKVLVVEKNNLFTKDNRTLAVNSNSRDFLASLGLWEILKTEHEPINTIIIRDFINKESLSFNNKSESMGSVIFNKSLLKISQDYLKKRNLLFTGIDLNIKNIKPKSKILINSNYYYFKKIILSLGKNEEKNEIINKVKFKSNHQAYVGFFQHQKNHNQRAYEIFTPYGPLAVLPSPSSTKKYSTFIFSTKQKMDLNNLSTLINKNFNSSHGLIKIKNELNKFSITPHIARPIQKDYLLIGDTAHSIHPVAGQGWNLGIKDIQTLCDNLEQHDLENPLFDNIYYSKRIVENIIYLSFTSLINNLYEGNFPLSKQLVKNSFSALNRFEYLRNLFIKQAMGKIKLI